MQPPLISSLATILTCSPTVLLPFAMLPKTF